MASAGGRHRSLTLVLDDNVFVSDKQDQEHLLPVQPYFFFGLELKARNEQCTQLQRTLHVVRLVHNSVFAGAEPRPAPTQLAATMRHLLRGVTIFFSGVFQAPVRPRPCVLSVAAGWRAVPL